MKKVTLTANDLTFPELSTSSPSETDNYSAYAKWLRARGGDTLVSYKTVAQLDDIVANVQSACRSSVNNSFYLDDLDDISQQTLVANNGAYEITDSPLVQFLKEAKSGDTLILHKEANRSEHIGYNSMLDEVRKLGDVEISKDLRIITLIPEENQLDFGPDFSSRFDVITSLNRTLKTTNVLNSKIDNDDNNNNVFRIQLYDDDYWHSKTVGQFKFSGHAISYTHGQLIEALNEKQTEICFVNPPNTREWEVFYHQILNRRQFEADGKTYKIPESVNISCVTEAYKHGQKNFKIEPLSNNNCRSWDVILSPATLSEFFQRFYSDDQSELHDDLAGLLEANQNKTLNVLLAHDLTPGMWAQLYDEAKKHRCTLSIIDATKAKIETKLDVTLTNQVITTSDEDDVVYELCKKDQNACVINVSKTTDIRDLVGSISCDNTGKKMSFQFEEGALVKLLKEKKHVILKGELSANCELALATLFTKHPYLWVNGQRVDFEGKLTIVSENRETLPYIYQRDYDWRMRERLSFSQKQLLKRAEENDERIFDVVKQHNPKDPTPYPEGDAAEFDRIRLEKLTKVLDRERSIFMIGPTASGKSTLVAKQLRKQENVKVRMGLKKLKKWATDTSDQIKVLLIDEANLLDEEQLDVLAGLFTPTPGILIDRKWYPLDDKHKIIFAGNPLTYGGRKMHSMWERHVIGEVFGELPAWYIKQRVIDPLCEILNDDPEKINLDTVKDMTPRDVQQMILEQVLASDDAITDDLKSSLKENGFILTKGREPILNSLKAQLLIREKKLEHKKLTTQGKDAIILEGDAGEGKSLMVEALLKSEGFVKGNRHEENKGTQIYYHLSAADYHDLERLLTKAFHEGAVVIIDEINTYPDHIERLINTLLSGTDLKNKKPKQPGFTIFGTQNPEKSAALNVKYKARKRASKAAANRSKILQIESYERDELIEIVSQIGVNDRISALIVDDYLMAVYEAVSLKKPIIPTPRDLFKHAKKIKNKFANDDIIFDEPLVNQIQSNLNAFKARRQEELQYKASTESNMIQLKVEESKYVKEIDADTVNDPNTVFEITKYFEGDARHDYYRLKVRLPDNVKNISIDNKAFSRIDDARKKAGSISDARYAACNVALTPEWKPLPSLTPYDEIQFIQCDVDIELGYSKETNLYYVRSEKESLEEQFIEFVVTIDENKNLAYESLDEHVEYLDGVDVSCFNQFRFNRDGTLDEKASSEPLALLNKYNSAFEKSYLLRRFFRTQFNSGKLNVKERASYYEVINSIINDKKGACRHRANAFFEIVQALKIPARLIESDSHRFCEIKHDGNWFRAAKIGGFDGKEKIIDLTERGAKEDAKKKIAELKYMKENGFFKEKPVFKKMYSDNPGGVMVVERAIAGKPSWLNSSVSYEVGDKSKPILVTNPVVSEKFLELYQHLYDSGFDLYLWLNNAPIKCKDINRLKRLLKFATTDVPSQPNFKLLDYYGAEKLKHCDQTNYDYLLDLSDFESIDELQRHIDLGRVETLKVSGPGLEERLDYSLRSCVNLESLIIGGGANYIKSVLGINQTFQYLKGITFAQEEKSKVSAEDIINVLNVCPALITFNFYECKFKDGGYGITGDCPISQFKDRYSLKNLRLDLNSSGLNGEIVTNLLNRCPELVKLELKEFKDVNWLKDLDVNTQFKHLKHIEICKGKLDDLEGLILLVKRCPNLEFLDVQVEGLSLRLERDKKTGLMGLRVIRANENEDNLGALIRFLAALPMVEHFSTPKSTKLLDRIFSADNKRFLENLKVIEASDVGEQSINDILSYCSHLQELEISGWYKNIIIALEILNEQKTVNSSVKLLSLIHSKIDEQGFNNLLRSCPNVQKVKIRKCKNIQKKVSSVKNIQGPNQSIFNKAPEIPGGGYYKTIELVRGSAISTSNEAKKEHKPS